MPGCKVYKYGARTPGQAPLLRGQMRLGHEYYNALVEAENDRRKSVWGGDTPAPPPHDNCNCDECVQHWRDIQSRMRATPPLDLKPLRAEYSARGLCWGTYLLIEQAFSAAWKTARSTRTVRFRSWRQGAVAGVQIQKARQGRPERLFRIEKAPDLRTGRRARGGRGRHLLYLRIGTDGREPLWSEPIPFELHRLLAGVVTYAKVRVRYIADREIWSVAFDVRDVEEREHGIGTVAVDVSWRKTAAGTRLAYAQDDDGNIDELLLGPQWEELTARADRIRSVRDQNLNMLKSNDARLSRIRSWSGVQRKARELDDDVSDEIEQALRRDRHLRQYEAGCRDRSQRIRRARLQEWVSALRSRYDTVVVKKAQTKRQKEDKTPVQDGGLAPAARRRGHHAAPGETYELLRAVFGASMSAIRPTDTTRTCVECAHVSDHGPELLIRCERCGAEHDRDWASTRNMLRQHHAGDTVVPTARKTTARFAKRHKKPKNDDNASATD